MTIFELKPILTLLDPLRDLGVLDAADADRVQLLAEQAATVAALARNHAVTRNDNAAKAASALLARDAEITADRLAKAAAAVVAEADVQLVADHVERQTVLQAKSLAFARVGELPAIVNAEFAAITARVTALFGELRGVRTAHQAIESGRVDEYRELTALKARYGALVATVEQLRAHRLIPGPRTQSERGQHWQYKLPGDVAEFRVAMAVDDDGFRLLAYSVGRQPWVPASAAEAVAVAATWPDAA